MRWRGYSDAELVSEYETTGPGRTGKIINYKRYVETPDGRRFLRNDRKSAIALATLFEVLDQLEPSEAKEGHVSVEAALRGKPAIATFLIGVHEMSMEEVATVMDVAEPTVQKYISRFKPYTRN
jgi:DNA-directed RNA polymerase specialized sigma24 family protein